MSRQGRVALVTGGAGGIGTAICHALAAGGRRVAVADLDVERARRVADAVGGVAVAMDVCDEATVRAAVAAVNDQLGPVAVLVSCAGWDGFIPFVDTDEAYMRRVLDINLAGAMRVTRAVLPAMAASGWGRLVFISSDAGRVGSSLESVYAGAKAGLTGFAKTIAREHARDGVTANVVCPGPTETALLDGFVSASADAGKVVGALRKAVPMGRLGTPADVAPAVAFLASDAAGFITGQTLSVSGGLTMV